MTLQDFNADDMLKGSLMQDKPSELFLHYLKYQPELVNAIFRQAIRYEYISEHLIEAMDRLNMDRYTVLGEVVKRLENMPSKEFH